MMDGERPSEPDSTTLEKDVRQEFRKDEDVLCLNSEDGCFYLGTIVQVDPIYKKCLVEFLDNTTIWSSFKNLKVFAPQDSETCYVCKTSDSKNDEKILVCKCGRAYHQHCHESVNENADTQNWECQMCAPSVKQKEEKVEKESVAKEKVSKEIALKSVTKSVQKPTFRLPYNLNSLTWDVHHRVNEQRRYCYCGKNGNWSVNMVQCRRCKQWFHSQCTVTISRPIFPGDRFYFFVCTICNDGKEYSRRLAMKWPDVVHIVLYNLSHVIQNKYYDIDNAILPYLNKHWDEINLPPRIANTPINERRLHVVQSLVICDKRFKCGTDVRKKSNLWRLRFRGAPKPPQLSLPSRGVINDKVLKSHCKSDFVTYFDDVKPLQNGFINSSEAGSHEFSEKSEQKIVPPIIINVPKSCSTSLNYSISDKVVTTKISDNHTTDSKVISSTEYHGRGLVKRSTPFPPQDQANNLDTRFRSHAVRKAKRLLNKNMKRKKKTAQTSVLPFKSVSDSSDENTSDNSNTKSSDSCDEYVPSNRNKMLLRKRQPIRKRPQRNLLEARLNSTESKLYNPFVSIDSSRIGSSNSHHDNNKKSPSRDTTTSAPWSVKKRSKYVRRMKNNKIKNKKEKYVQKSIYDSFKLKLTGKPKLEIEPASLRHKNGDDKSVSIKTEKNLEGSENKSGSVGNKWDSWEIKVEGDENEFESAYKKSGSAEKKLNKSLESADKKLENAEKKLVNYDKKSRNVEKSLESAEKKLECSDKLKNTEDTLDSADMLESPDKFESAERKYEFGMKIQSGSDKAITSTDDETSSRGTLDAFIPTPKDFEGQSNPFRSVTDLLNTAAGVAPAANPPITLPLPLKTVIPHINPPRLKKRQLSEKDIIIDRNGQVKRRRRWKYPNGFLQRTLTQHGTAAKSAEIVPSKKKNWTEKQSLQPLANNCVDARQLRNRESLKGADKQASSTRPPSAKCSPTKETAPASEDFESSVKYFFGPASRIASGEKYEIRAKRITFDGRMQCIVDWKTSYPT